MSIMKRLLLLSVVLLAGCGQSEVTYGEPVNWHRVIKVRDCEYVQSRSYPGSCPLVHAGDCRNPKHKTPTEEKP